MTYAIRVEPVLSTAQVCRKLGFNVSVAFLKRCGLSPLSELANGVFWRSSDMPIIRQAIAHHILNQK